MTAANFKSKYGIGVEDFFAIYIERKLFDSSYEKAYKVWNKEKTLNMLRDLPLIEIKESNPERIKHVKNLIKLLESKGNERRK